MSEASSVDVVERGAGALPMNPGETSSGALDAAFSTTGKSLPSIATSSGRLLSPIVEVTPATLGRGSLRGGLEFSDLLVQIGAVRSADANGVRLLADVADVSDTVMLAEAIRAKPRELELQATEVPDTAWVRRHLDEQLSVVGRAQDRMFRQTGPGKGGIPDAAGCAQLLAEKEGVDACSRHFGERLLLILRTLRRDVLRVRAELGEDLRRLAGDADRLERTDSALRRTAEHAMLRRDEAAAAAFSRRTAHFITEHGSIHPSETDVDGWFRRGFLASVLRDMESLCRAALQEERLLMRALCDAALVAYENDYRSASDRLTSQGPTLDVGASSEPEHILLHGSASSGDAALEEE